MKYKNEIIAAASLGLLFWAYSGSEPKDSKKKLQKGLLMGASTIFAGACLLNLLVKS